MTNIMKQIKRNQTKFLIGAMIFLLAVCGLCAYIYGSFNLFKVLVWCVCIPTFLFLLLVIKSTKVWYGTINLNTGKLKVDKEVTEMKEGEYILLRVRKDENDD